MLRLENYINSLHGDWLDCNDFITYTKNYKHTSVSVHFVHLPNERFSGLFRLLDLIPNSTCSSGKAVYRIYRNQPKDEKLMAGMK